MEEPSRLRQIFGILVLILGAFMGFYLFYDVIVLLYKGIFFKHEIIVFKKTSMYLLGGGVFCASLMFFAIKYVANKKQIPNTKRNFYIIFVFPMIIIFILPQIISFYVHTHIENIHFIECKKESASKFRYTKYVFAKDIKTCTKFEAYEEKMR